MYAQGTHPHTTRDISPWKRIALRGLSAASLDELKVDAAVPLDLCNSGHCQEGPILEFYLDNAVPDKLRCLGCAFDVRLWRGIVRTAVVACVSCCRPCWWWLWYITGAGAYDCF